MFFRSTRPAFFAALLFATVTAGGGLTSATATGAGDPAGSSRDQAGSSREVIARTGDLTARISPSDPSPDPARQIVSARVRQDLRKGTIGGTIRLGAAATAATGADLIIGFGFREGSVCRGAADLVLDTLPGGSPEATYAGAAITAHEVTPDAARAKWDCAYVGLSPKGGGGETYDGLVGTVRPVYAPPVPKLRLKVGRSVPVKPGRWAKVKLTASNPGTGPTPKVTVRLRPRAAQVKPKRLKLARIGAGKTRSSTFRVRLTRRKQGAVKLVASAGKLRARAKVAVKRKTVVRRTPPGAGSYSGSGVDFRITPNRYLTGFRITLPITCGGYPDLPTTTWGHYSFRTVRIPASGKIDATEKGDLYTAYLEATVRGNRVTNGVFRYFGPARGTGHKTWSARRKR